MAKNGWQYPEIRDRITVALMHLSARDKERPRRGYVSASELGRRMEMLLPGIEVSRQTVRSWLEGHIPRTDPLGTLRALAAVLGVSPEWLVFGAGKAPWDYGAPGPSMEPPKLSAAQHRQIAEMRDRHTAAAKKARRKER